GWRTRRAGSSSAPSTCGGRSTGCWRSPPPASRRCPTASTSARSRPRPRPAARARFAGSGPMVGFAGRLVYEKGVQDLLAAVPRLAAEHAGLRVVLAGDGPYKAELVEEIRGHRLHGVVSFTGF